MRKPSPERKLQLLQYSALSLAFIGPHTHANGQVFYQDVDPDSTCYIDEYELDMDNDGSVDFKLVFNTDIFASFAPPEIKLRINPLGSNSVGYLYQSVPVTYSGMPFSTYIDGATAIMFTDVPMLNADEWVDGDLDFHMEKAALFEQLFFYIYSESNYTAIPGGYWNGAGEHFAPIRLFSDGAYHYGWLRLQVDVATGIKLLDYAYELNPETAIQALSRDYKIEWLTAGDAGITETTADIAFSFSAAANQEDIAAYRIFCVPGSDVDEMTADIAASLTSDRYLEIIPDGSETYAGTFAGINLDSNGDPIVEGVNYKLMMVKMMSNGYLPLLSQPSLKFSLINTVQAPVDVTVSDLGDTGTGADIRVKFDAPAIDQGISEYRIIMVQRDSADDFTLDDALLVTPENYTAVAVGDVDYSIMLTDATTDAYGQLIYLDKYKAFVMSIADGVTVANDSLSEVSGVVVIETATATTSTPVLSDVNETATGFDLQVSFEHGNPERTVETYQLYFVDFAEAFDFDVAKAQASTYFIPFTPDGTDFSFTGNDTLRDSNGDLITWGVPYYAWVLSVSSDFGISDTLSAPSNQVILNFPVGITSTPDPMAILHTFDNFLVMQLPSDATMEIFDVQGRLIMTESLSSGNHRIATNLPSGIYLVKLEGEGWQISRSVMLAKPQ